MTLHVGSIEASPSIQGGVWHCLYDGILPTTHSFLFFSFLSPPLKIHIGHSNFQFSDIWTLILIFYFLFFILGSCAKFQFVFNFIIRSIIVICYFSNMIFIVFILILIVYILLWFWFFFINFSFQFKILGCPLIYSYFKLGPHSINCYLFLFLILLYNWFIF
jgi:hypothetical protein